jgi:hypothetical protein
MSIFVKVRDENYAINTEKGKRLWLKRNLILRAQQPDNRDNKEFNLKIFYGIKNHYVSSIDFDFFSTRKEAQKGK